MSLLSKRFEQEEGFAIFNGNEVLAKAGLESGVAFWTGYPGSPVASIHNTLEDLSNKGALFDRKGIVYHRALNEMTASAELGGAQKVGVNAVATAKNVGFLWMMDHLVYENFNGTGEGSGALVVIGDDITASSSTVPLDTRLGFELLKMPYLQPSTNQEIKDFFTIGLKISQASGLYVGLRLESSQGDSGSTISVASNVYPSINAHQRINVNIPPAQVGPQFTLMVEQAVDLKMATAIRVAAEHEVNRIFNSDAPPTLGLIGSGKSFADLFQALRDMGLHDKIRILKIGMPYPLDESIVLDFVRDLEQVVVLESKEPILEEHIQAILQRAGINTPVYGKQFPAGMNPLPRSGELGVDNIKATLGPLLVQAFPQYADAIRDELGLMQAVSARSYTPTPLRLPTFCPGCPHRASVTLVHEKKFGDSGFIPLQMLEDSGASGPDTAPEKPGLLIHGDIGCYTMAIFPPFQMLDSVSAMGQGGAVGDGMAPFSTNQRVVFVGDGTFIHSGRNSVLSSLNNGTDITYIVLNNDTIAMTGGQSTPFKYGKHTSGFTLENILRGYGVKHITHIDSDEAYAQKYRSTLDRYMDIPGVKAIIVDKECAITEGRRERREQARREAQGIYEDELHYRINPDICEMCYDCGQKTACLGLDIAELPGTVYGRKMQINKSTCYNDGACLVGNCPSFQKLSIKRADPTHVGEAKIPEESWLVPPDHLPAIGDGYNIYVPGVGGMGVMTVSALLSYAALFDNKLVTFTNRVGLAQKNGAVDSHIILRESEEAHATKISTGKTDLYLCMDLLEGARSLNLNLIAPDRTFSVVNSAKTETVLTIVGANQFPQTDGLVDDIARYSKGVQALDAFDVAEKLLGNRLYANLFVLGVAYQSSALPLSPAALEEAIALNGRDIQRNLAAFRWGRLWVSDRERVEAALAQDEIRTVEQLVVAKRGYLLQEPGGKKLAADYDDLLAAAPDLGEEGNHTLAGWLYTLLQWQDAAYAREYLDFVRGVAEQDGGDYAFTRTVAHNLARLMAYKDEFEVARLALNAEEKDRLRREYRLSDSDRVQLTYVLDPPWLQTVGRRGKIHFKSGLLTEILFRSLRALKGARRWLPVTHEVRKLERSLPGWYRDLTDKLLSNLNDFNYTEAIAIADMARGIVGYDDIKLNNWRRIRKQVEDQLGPYTAPEAQANISLAA